MNRKKELAKNTFIISFGTLLPKLASLITLPVITACLTKTDLGSYDLITTLVSLVLPVVTLQIQTAAFRFLIDCRGDNEQTNRIVSNIVIFTIPISIISVVVLFFSLSSIITAKTRLFICIYFFIDILMLTMHQVVRGLSFIKLYSVSSVIQALVNVILIYYTVSYKSFGLDGVLISAAVATFISLLILFICGGIYKRVKVKMFSISVIKSLLAYSWPMVPNSLSNWVLNFSDRTVLLTFIGLEANAIYAVANKIPLLFTTIQGTFIMAWQENASIAISDNDNEKYYTSVFEGVFRIMCGVMAILIAFTPWLFRILIKGDYSDAYPHIPILFMGLLYSACSAFLGGIYVAHKKTKSVGVTTIIAAALNLLIDLFLVRLIGILAASISTLIAYLFLFIFRLIDVKRFQPIKYNYSILIGFNAVLIVLCIVCWVNSFYLNIVNAILGLFFALTINRNTLGSIVGAIRKKIHQ